MHSTRPSVCWRAVELQGDVEITDTDDRAVVAAPCSVLRLAPFPEPDRGRRRGHIGVQRLLEVLGGPTAGEHEVLLGAGQQAVERIALEPFEELDLGGCQLVSDVMPGRRCDEVWGSDMVVRLCRRADDFSGVPRLFGWG